MTNKRLINVILSLVVLAASVATLITAVPAANASAGTLKVWHGSIGDGQSLDALAELDQRGTADNWQRYIEFEPGDSRHVSQMWLPVLGDGNILDITINYRGPDGQEARWKLWLYDYEAERWRRIFTNRDAPDWVWSETTLRRQNATRFVQDGTVKARYVSTNDPNGDVSQLDALIFELSGEPATPPEEPTPAPPTGIRVPPAHALFDYQIGQDYPLPAGVTVVSRDWHDGQAAAGAYSICYVNAFQTQPDDAGSDRIDATSNWPAHLVLTELAQDPGWSGEYLIDISTPANRSQAAGWVATMVDTCAAKGFDAVEFDNLDSWTRFEESPSLHALVPFGQPEAVEFAKLITNHAHQLGLAVGQKNTTQLIHSGDHERIGFDFAIAEQCGQYNECGDFVAGYGDAVIVIEYTAAGMRRACATYGDQLSIVRRDLLVRTPGDSSYVYEVCG